MLTTVHNGAAHLHECIASILQQEYEAFSFIIVDDGSTDDSVSIIEAFDDARILLYRTEHQGRVHALNFGIRHCHGSYCAIVDADDVSRADRLSKQINYLASHPECGVVGSWVEMINERGKRIRLQQYPESHEDILETMAYYCSVAFPAAMFRTAVFNAFGAFNPEFVSHDLEYWMRLLPRTKLHNLPEPLLQYRYRPDSLSRTKRKETLEETYTLGIRFSTSRTDLTEAERLFLLARVEYYHGSVHRARAQLITLLREYGWNSLHIRYLLPTFLGDRLLRCIRSTALQRVPGMLTKRFSSRKALSPP
ncbi:MAG: glycosyltransferase [Bacteroidetes bacterium]|nr:glycosyltransferase [Bacteroidota bacterium]